MSCQLPPIPCGRCGCDPSVTININGGGSGAMYSGYENPNDSGFLPTDTTVISTFDILTPDGYYGTTLKWNVQHQFWG